MESPVLEGYPRLSALMGRDPPLAIFRRYRKVATRDLLYMQAEINELEHELDEIAWEDHRAGDVEKRLYCKDWSQLAKAKGEDSLQWVKIIELRAKLDAYYTAVLKAEKVFNLRGPVEQDLRFFRQWLSRPHSGDNFLRGLEASIWDSEHTGDFLALRARPGEYDKFTLWLVNEALAWFHRNVGYRWMRNRPKDEEAGFREYNDMKLVTLMEILVTSLSSMIPVMATIALYFVRGMTVRLVLVAVFMMIFCTSLAVFTNGRRVEIFAATAAYAPQPFAKQPFHDDRDRKLIPNNTIDSRAFKWSLWEQLVVWATDCTNQTASDLLRRLVHSRELSKP